MHPFLARIVDWGRAPARPKALQDPGTLRSSPSKFVVSRSARPNLRLDPWIRACFRRHVGLKRPARHKEDRMSATSEQSLPQSAPVKPDLGQMPVWDLRDLYPAPQSPEIEGDLKTAAAEAKRIKDRYEGEL